MMKLNNLLSTKQLDKMKIETRLNNINMYNKQIEEFMGTKE